MKTIRILGLALAMMAITAHAQQTVVKGVLVDSVLNEGEPYASVRIFRQGDMQKPVAMFLTEKDGTFKREVKGSGQFYAIFSSVGKQDLRKALTLGGKAEVDMGRLLISDNPTLITGVEVVAQKPLVKMEVDKMTYQVAEDADSKASTVLDMLRKVPMVTVDGQDNITVNGSGNFKVYVDGKPNVMLSSNPSVVLKSMPASVVKSIEVMTNPGAKYDAEGATGILNIVMNKQEGAARNMDGYNGSVQLTAGTNSSGGSVFVNGQKGKLSFSGNGMYYYSYPGTIETTVNREQDGAGTASGVNMVSNMKNRVPFRMGKLALGYDLDEAGSLNAALSVTDFTMKNTSRMETAMTGGALKQGFSYGSNMRNEVSKTSFTGSIDYQRFLNKARSSSLTLAYLLTYAPATNELEQDFEQDSPQPWMNLTDHFSVNREKTTEHIVQADLTVPVGKGQTLSTGAKLTSRNDKSNADLNLGNVPAADMGMDYAHKNNIAAGYAEYAAQAGKWSAKGGMRYEYTWQNVEYRSGNGKDFEKDYANWVPSASLSYSIAPTKNVGLTYNLRISRPGISYLNPYVNRSNATDLTYGNTNLDVEETHNIGLVYNTYSPKLMLNVNVRQSFSDDGIEQYSFFDKGLLHTTFGNIAQKRQTGLNVYANWLLAKTTRLFMNGGVSYNDLRSKQLDMANHGWQGNVMVGLQQTLPWALNLGAYFIASSKTYTLQGSNAGHNILTANISKSLLKDKLTLSVNAFAGLSKGGNLEMETFSRGADFTNRQLVKVPMKGVMLNVSYKFGNAKQPIKQHQTKVQSDFMEKKSDNESINGMNMQK